METVNELKINSNTSNWLTITMMYYSTTKPVSTLTNFIFIQSLLLLYYWIRERKYLKMCRVRM